MKTTPRRLLGAIVVLTALGHGPVEAKAPARHYAAGGGIVTDLKTKLAWQQVASSARYSWDDAKAHCKGLDLGGPGWRMPTVKELLTIVDDAQDNPTTDPLFAPTTDPQYSAAVATGNFWTATPAIYPASYIWYVGFAYGQAAWIAPAGQLYVRCVR